MKQISKLIVCCVVAAAMTACDESSDDQIDLKATSAPPASQAQSVPEAFYGTTEPFASEAVYFLLTDRFADGDPSNNFPEQGGEYPSFNVPWNNEQGEEIANLGYLGGDFKGIVDNAQYIADMGFTSVWITPIVDNPDAGFSGSHTPDKGPFSDHRKSGYHGYWGTNFYKVDEHLESTDLKFADLTRRLREEFGLKTVLDMVCNHGSPSFSMPQDQPGYGEIYDQQGQLLADHQNLEPKDLDPSSALHQWFHRERDLAELSNLDDTNPEVLDYMVGAYLKWIDQGAYALRIDTIRHMPHAYWKQFSDRIRAEHPGLFMFGERFEYDAEKVAEHMKAENGDISVLDFPGQAAITKVFQDPASDFADIQEYLHLTDGVYDNPYKLAIFYDNHDMARMNASEEGFIDANNWLFTSRGFPVVYYGSEVRFMAGAAEHAGNRNFFGPENIAKAKTGRIRAQLSRIAKVRKATPALQRGVQVNLDFDAHQAAFLRVVQRDGVNQTALVLLNKGDNDAVFSIDQYLSAGQWTDAVSGESVSVSNSGTLETTVPGHGVRVMVLNQPVSNPALLDELRRAVKTIRRS